MKGPKLPPFLRLLVVVPITLGLAVVACGGTGMPSDGTPSPEAGAKAGLAIPRHSLEQVIDETDRNPRSGSVPQPRYLPEGFSFLNGQIGYDNRAANVIAANYRAPGGALTITEFEQPLVPSVYLDPSEVIREWDTGRYHVVLFDPDGQPKNLTAMTAAIRWAEGRCRFEVKGNIALEEMIRVADSMTAEGC